MSRVGGMAPFLDSATMTKEERMPFPPIVMRKFREVLRLRLSDGSSYTKIAAALGILLMPLEN